MARLSPKRPRIPFEFILDHLGPVQPSTKAMFGRVAVYSRGKLVLWLSEKERNQGIALATTYVHHASLRAEFPNLRSLLGYDQDPTEWQLLPADAPDFEESAVRACELICARDPRIGKTPATKRRRG